jgi:hypothetical protein
MPLDRLVEVAYANTHNESKMFRYLDPYFGNSRWILDYYTKLCITGEKVGSEIGGAIGFTIAAATPSIVLGTVVFVLEKVASKIMTRLK